MANLEVHTGSWNDMSSSTNLQGTLTLSGIRGFLLIAGLSTLIGLSGMSAWRAVRFWFHWSKTTSEKSDGLDLQHRLILRNSGSPAQAFEDALRVYLAWRKFESRALERTVVLLCGIFGLWAIFITAGVLVGLIANGSPYVLLEPTAKCGIWNFTSKPEGVWGSYLSGLQDTINGRAYARERYPSVSNTSDAFPSESIFAVQSLSYTSNIAACPFNDTLCNPGSNTAWSMDTGLLNSDSDFGINAQVSDRIYYRKVVTCSPIHSKAYAQDVSGSGPLSNETFVEIYFGPVGNLSEYTFSYDTHQGLYDLSYQLSSFVSNSGPLWQDAIEWTPIPVLYRTDADVSVHFLAPNRVNYVSPVNDTWFQATTQTTSGYYSSDYAFGALACADQLEICNPNNQVVNCTGLMGLSSIVSSVNTIGLNADQLASATRLIWASEISRTFDSVFGLRSSALQAQELLFDLLSLGLPSNQWHIEVQLWFETSLAKLQKYIVDFVSNEDLSQYATFVQAENLSQALFSQCGNQRIIRPASVWNFNVVGLIVVITLSSVILLSRLCVMWLFWIFRLFLGGDRFGTKIDDEKLIRVRRARDIDDKFYLHRLAWERMGFDNWTRPYTRIPTSSAGYVFPTILSESDSTRDEVDSRERRFTAFGKHHKGSSLWKTRQATKMDGDGRNHERERSPGIRKAAEYVPNSSTRTQENTFSRTDAENFMFYKIAISRGSK